MSIGMSYDDFWNGDVCMVRAYRKAQELRDKRSNQEAWLQGMYFYEALCDASPLFRFSMKKGVVKPEPYLKEPYPITAEEVREREEREARVREERMKAAFAAFAEQIRKKMPAEAHPGTKGGETNEYHY
jgi:hypothetical protein